MQNPYSYSYLVPTRGSLIISASTTSYPFNPYSQQLLTRPWRNDPRYSRGHPQWIGRATYPNDCRFFNDQDFNSARGVSNMSRRECEEVWRSAQARVNDPYFFPRQRSGAYATMGNIYAAEDTDRRERGRRRRNTGVDEVADWISRIAMGDRGSRGRSGCDVRFYDQYATPEPSRTHPRHARYYLDRASRPRNTNQGNYNDAYQYINGRHPGRRTKPVGGRHDPREYAGLNLRFGLNGSRNRDPASSCWDRMRKWF